MASSKRGITVVNDIQINDDDSVSKVKRVKKAKEENGILKKLKDIDDVDIVEDTTKVEEDNKETDIAFNQDILNALNKATGYGSDQLPAVDEEDLGKWVKHFDNEGESEVHTLSIDIDEDDDEIDMFSDDEDSREAEDEIDLLEDEEDEQEQATDRIDLLEDEEEEQEELSLGSTDLISDDDYEEDESEKEDEQQIDSTKLPTDNLDDSLTDMLSSMAVPSNENADASIARLKANMESSGEEDESLLGSDYQETEQMIRDFADKVNNTKIEVEDVEEEEHDTQSDLDDEMYKEGEVIECSDPKVTEKVTSVIKKAEESVNKIDEAIHAESKSNTLGVDEEEMQEILKSANVDMEEVERNKAIIHGSDNDVKGYYKNTIGEIELEEQTIDPIYSPTDELLNDISISCSTELAILADKRTLTDALTQEIYSSGKYYVEIENKEYSSAALPAGTELIKRGDKLFCAFTSVPDNYTGYRKPLKEFIANLQKAIRTDLFDTGMATFPLVDENGINILTVNEFKLIDQFLTKNKLVHRIAGTNLVILC